MKNKIGLGLVVASSIMALPLNVNAKGVATVDFTSVDTINIGESFKVYMSVNNVKDTYDGVVSLSGRLTYDTNKIEYVDAKSLATHYEFYINPRSMMIAGLDFTLDNGIYENTKIYEFTFKAKEVGNASITLKEVELTDSKDYIDSKVNQKNVTISNVEENTIQLNEAQLTNSKEYSESIKKEAKTSSTITVKKETNDNKEKLNKINNYVHSLLKKLSNLI